jgi:hypothetical protein
MVEAVGTDVTDFFPEILLFSQNWQDFPPAISDFSQIPSDGMDSGPTLRASKARLILPM